MFFSIITCSLNSAKYISYSINSLTKQNFHNYEHIIVDAYSTDETVNIINKYALAFPDKVRIVNQKPEGIAAAMNYGASQAKGEVLSFLNSDDAYASSNVLQTVFDVFQQNPTKKWYIGDQDFIDENGIITKHYTTPAYSYEWLKRTNFIPHQATFIKKELFDSIKGFANYKYGMDYDMWLKIGEKNSPLQGHKTISLFRQHPLSATTKGKKKAELELYKIRKQLKRTPWMKIKDSINLLCKLITL